ncbi:MAG: DUF5063 domain-containing protein [Muribaculaceae bacterium]|nr:DUF5063 domain-containing protein [Muribaculaceae bacterium]
MDTSIKMNEDMMDEARLTPGQLSFIALANEYCQAIETAGQTDREDFVSSMLRLLPRLYIVATDLPPATGMEEDGYVDNYLDEDTYNIAREQISNILGMDDTYLEVFEEDMKYSDTPIGASISEGLCDIFQSLYNFLSTVKDAPVDLILGTLVAQKEDFEHYWSQILCNNLRALNALRYND